MWLFLKRYFGRYLWLGFYTTAVGAVAGILCFFPFLPIFVIIMPRLFLTAYAFAAPLNIVMLPIAFHLLRNHSDRLFRLRIAGAVGGFFSPTIAALIWGLIDPTGPWTVVIDPAQLAKLWRYAPAMITFSMMGSIAGFVCAKRFHRHGDRPSVFDVNAALQSQA